MIFPPGPAGRGRHCRTRGNQSNIISGLKCHILMDELNETIMQHNSHESAIALLFSELNSLQVYPGWP